MQSEHGSTMRVPGRIIDGTGDHLKPSNSSALTRVRGVTRLSVVAAVSGRREFASPIMSNT